MNSLIKEEANIDVVNAYGWTALMGASFNGYKKVVNSLIKAGTYINTADNDGNTALIWASFNGRKEVVDKLINGGTYINAVDNDGKSALLWAYRNGYKDIIDSLIKAGANPYIKDNNGTSFDLAGIHLFNPLRHEELKKYIIKKRGEYVTKKYKEYLIDGKNRMENLAGSLQKEYDWYKPWDENKSENDEHHLQEVKQSYPFPKDIARVIAKFAYGISDNEWAQMRRLENEQQSLK